jgi:hypothetical protein
MWGRWRGSLRDVPPGRVALRAVDVLAISKMVPQDYIIDLGHKYGDKSLYLSI